MVELDYDQVLLELISFSQKPDSDEFPEILERYLQMVAKNGDIVFPWRKVKPFLRKKLESVMEDFYQKYPLKESQLQVPNCDQFDYKSYKSNIMEYFHYFNEAPFTIQRFCELLTEPDKHYQRADKFMRGLSKTMIVISSVQPRPNKYVSLESIEKQPSFRDLCSHYNTSTNSSSPSNHLSSTSSTSSSTTTISPSTLLNGVDVGQHSATTTTSHFENQYGTVVHLHSNASFYSDNGTQSSANSLLNTGAHHQSHLLEHPPLASSEALHLNHSPLQSPHHLTSATLAPLQQLDSFTNVFASNTTGHLTHLTNSTYSLANSHPCNGRIGLLAGASEVDNRNFMTAAERMIYDRLLHNEHLNNDENENIIVDDDYDDDDEEGVEEDSRDSLPTQDTVSVDSDKHSQDSVSSCSSSNSDSNESFPEKSTPSESDIDITVKSGDKSDVENLSESQVEESFESDSVERKRLQAIVNTDTEEANTLNENTEIEEEKLSIPKKIKIDSEVFEEKKSFSDEVEEKPEAIISNEDSNTENNVDETEIVTTSVSEIDEESPEVKIQTEPIEVPVPMEVFGSSSADNIRQATQMQTETISTNEQQPITTETDVTMSTADDDDQIMDEPMDQE